MAKYLQFEDNLLLFFVRRDEIVNTSLDSGLLVDQTDTSENISSVRGDICERSSERKQRKEETGCNSSHQRSRGSKEFFTSVGTQMINGAQQQLRILVTIESQLHM